MPSRGCETMHKDYENIDVENAFLRGRPVKADDDQIKHRLNKTYI